MSTTTQLMSATELLELPRGRWRYELTEGELHRTSPTGHTHGKVAARFAARLLQFVEARELGQVYAAETGFLLAKDPDTVRAPDAAFVSAGRLAAGETGFSSDPSALSEGSKVLAREKKLTRSTGISRLAADTKRRVAGDSGFAPATRRCSSGDARLTLDTTRQSNRLTG